ncbi:MAG: DeoR/GlpR transcriptional regulator [Clostridiaceae bacterium]|nr:DeoR/GlpR transcriptional regulator [Clostridiaceae bacterium]
MFAAERLRIIKTYMLDKKKATVSEISRMLSVSEVTIRRDLEALDEEGFLTRTHGGAIINGEENLDALNNYVDTDPERQIREEISEVAIYLINDGDTLLLSPGLTNLAIARKLNRKKDLVVLTTDIRIAEELTTHPSARIILPGGDLDPLTHSLIGPPALAGLEQYYVSKAFIEVDGIHLKRGFSIKHPSQLDVLKRMMDIATQKYFVVAPSAFNQISFSNLGSLEKASALITHPTIPGEYKKSLFEKNITLYASFTAYRQA